MNRQAREFIDWITKNGYGKFEGETGSGHLRLILSNGETHIYSSTPGAYTAEKNAKSEVLRKLGLGSQSPKAGKIRHKPATGTRRVSSFDGPLTADLAARVAAIDRKLESIGDPRSSSIRQSALDLLRERIECTEEIERRGMQAKSAPDLQEPK